MKKFRLPRKEKKSLRSGLWLYPRDDQGNSRMAWPRRSQEDYDAMKSGIVRNMLDTVRERKKEKNQEDKLDVAVSISDDQLRGYVNDFFREDIRINAYFTLVRAKNSVTAIEAYYNFVNAYHLDKSGEHSYGNIGCLALERAENLLREENRIRKKRK